VASSAFLLAQIGEFSFILQKVGADAGLAPADRGDEGTQVFIAVAVILIAITPFLNNLGRVVKRRLEQGESVDMSG
jgi:CPA2 family monovalent cation:H+ antiporter-2